MIKTAEIQFDYFTFTEEFNAFRLRAYLANTGITRSGITECHFQRAPVDLGYGKAQFIVFTPTQCPAESLLSINLIFNASEYGNISSSIRAPQWLAFRMCCRSEINPSEISMAALASIRNACPCKLGVVVVNDDELMPLDRFRYLPAAHFAK